MERYAALDTNNLLELIDREASNPNPKVSIFFSVPHASDFAMFGHAELRSLIQRAARRMTFSGASLHARLEIEAALNDLSTSPAIWENRVDGYAIFATNETVRCYGLPRELNRLVVVSDNFYIRPLVQLLTTPHDFYIAEVSLGNVRLIKVMPQLLKEVPLGPLHHDRASFEGVNEPVHDRNFHSTRIAHGMAEAGATVPHGSHEDAKHAQGKRYLQHMAHLIDQEIRNEHVPLIIIGTESSRGHFVQGLEHKCVMSNSHDLHLPDLPNHAVRDASRLWQQCAEIVHEWQKHTSTDDAIANYYALEGIGLATHNVHEIRDLAITGKIQTLLLGDSLTIDGVLSNEQCDENNAIIDTLRHGGTVLEADPSRFHYPTGAIIRAGAYAEAFAHDQDTILS